MREIKFKANIKGTPIMLEGIALYDSGMIGMHPETLESQLPEGFEHDYDNQFIIQGEKRICEILQGDEWVWIESKNIEIIQYTGLKDKNWLDIYEGDLVKRLDGSVWEISFDKGAFNLKGAKPLYDVQGSLEVIGNVYEKEGSKK